MGKKTVYCHPKNLELIKKQFVVKEEKQRRQDEGFIHYLSPDPLYGINFVTDTNIPELKPSGKYRAVGNKFYTWWNGEGTPPSWALFFGLVEAIMEPVFYIIEDRSMVFKHEMFYGIPLIKHQPSFIQLSC